MSSESWLDRAENKISSLASTGEQLAVIAGESALHAAIQDPIDGLTQLANHISKPLTGYKLPHVQLVDAPPAAQKGCAEYYAETLGLGVGRAADYLLMAATLEVTGVAAAAGAAVGALAEGTVAAPLAAPVGEAALTGATYGFTMLPTNDEKHFWRDRTINGLGWGLGATAATLTAAGAVKALDFAGQEFVESGFSNTLIGRGIKAAVSSAASGLAKNQTYLELGQDQISPGTFGTRVVGSIANHLQ
jgi:hypothetical protein